MDRNYLTVSALKVFVIAVRRGSFASAARELGVTPSAVSRQIASAERLIGCRLLERTTRRLSLTQSGELFFQKIVSILEELDEAQDLARDTQNEPAGRIRVAASVAFGERWLVPRLPGFREQFPLISFELLLSDQVIDLIDQKVDVAIRLSDRIEGDYVVRKLMDTRYVIVASPDYLRKNGPINCLSDLSSVECLRFSMPAYQKYWRFRRKEEDLKIAVDGFLSISSAVALRRAALLGLGPALIAEWTVTDDLASGRLVQILNEWDVAGEHYGTAAWLVYPSRTYLPKKSRVFIDFLKSNVS